MPELIPSEPEYSLDDVLTNIKDDITQYLNSKDKSINWITEESGHKFMFNTMCNHEDEYGNLLELKSPEVLYNEMIHRINNNSITCLLHLNHDDSIVLYYD